MSTPTSLHDTQPHRSGPAPRGRRRAALLGGTALLLALGGVGCASLNQIHSEVSSYGSWPAGRSPGSYRIERLPSQAAKPAAQSDLERAAAAALAEAGFRPAAEGSAADVVVQVGARVSRESRLPWDDPLWWHAWGPRWNSMLWAQPGWAWRAQWERTDYQREVALLLRDRASGEALYEARARSEGVSAGGDEVLAAMFSAALKDFPRAVPEPHSVSVPVR